MVISGLGPKSNSLVGYPIRCSRGEPDAPSPRLLREGSPRIGMPTAARRWTAKEIQLLGTISDHELARRVRRIPNAVFCQRVALKIVPFRSPPKRRRLVRDRPWLPEEDKLVGTMREDHLAQRPGGNVKAVRYRRRRLGVPRAFAPLDTGAGCVAGRQTRPRDCPSPQRHSLQ
jgi:hypothetical protein